MIKVNRQQRQEPRVPRDARERVPGQINEQAPIREAGQRIMLGLRFQLRFRGIGEVRLSHGRAGWGLKLGTT
jgi:hypothetical protein